MVKNEAFVVQHSKRTFHSFQKDVCWASASDEENLDPEQNEDDENDWNTLPPPISMDNTPVGPEKSRMVNYISDFLKKGDASDKNNADNNSKKEENDEFTHLIAIPMGACAELAIELESVQRAILYHCPVLVHACVVPATTRLPLLYVRAPSSATATTTPQEATKKLHRIVQEVVQKHVFVKPDMNTDVHRVDDNGVIVSEEPLDGINEEGIRPLALTFQSLEIDGPNNQVLHTVALPDDPGTRRLQQLVLELQETIATQLQWETSLPPDDHIAANTGDDEDDNNANKPPQVFRPRLPFMRIPSNFETYLDPLPEDRDDELMRTSDEGGNGISPIFWASWWDDVFGSARLREIGIYPRTTSKGGIFGFGGNKNSDENNQNGNNGLGEQDFHMPFQLTSLPKGNDSLTKQEAKFESYQDQRIQQAEYDFEQDQLEEKGLKDSSAGEESSLEDDPMLEKTRARLETLYQQNEVSISEVDAETSEEGDLEQLLAKEKEEQMRRPVVDSTLLDEWTQQRIRQANVIKGNTMYNDTEDVDDDALYDDIKQEIQDSIKEDGSDSDGTLSTDKDTADPPDDPNQLDEWTRDRIRNTIEARQSVRSQAQLAVKKDKVPIQDNNIFQKFKDGTLVPEQKKKVSSTGKEVEAFPSREQFVGFWQIMASPTGFPPDDNGGDGSKSENLIFRVDGTTAGGPVLDPETNQKAAGGTWTVKPKEDGEAHVRIRLVIPPTKERILVMEGTAIQRSMISLKDLPPMASSTFGIPELEDKAIKASKDDTVLDEEKIYCSGKVRQPFVLFSL